MPEYQNLERVLETAIARSQRHSSRPGRASKKGFKQRLRAAHHAYELMWDNPDPPSLYADGDYVKLTGLLLKAATDEPQIRATNAHACGEHFKLLKEDGGNPYINRLRNSAPVMTSGNDDLERLMKAHAVNVEEVRRRRIQAEADFPSLHQLLDEMLR